MVRRRWRVALAAMTTCALVAGYLTAQPQSTASGRSPESRNLVPVHGADRQPLVEAGLAVWCSPGARYRVTAGQVVPAAGLFLYSVASGAPREWPQLQVPHRVTRGDPLRVYVASRAPLTELTVTVTLVDGARVQGRGFAVAETAAGTTWAVVIGIPSTAAAGAAQLLVEGRVGGPAEAPDVVRLLVAQSLGIGARSFAAEEIPLSAELTALRRTPDPRRVEQSRELWRVLSSWRPAPRRHLGVLRLPLGDVRRSAGFGDRRRYRYADGTIDLSIHNGVDFAAPEGTLVAAAGHGTVVLARPRIVTGLTVVVEHLPGVYTLYYHLARLVVQEGQGVAAGAALGTVGSTGLATGPHLHWEVRVAGVAVDPATLVAAPLVDTPGELVTMDR